MPNSAVHPRSWEPLFSVHPVLYVFYKWLVGQWSNRLPKPSPDTGRRIIYLPLIYLPIYFRLSFLPFFRLAFFSALFRSCSISQTTSFFLPTIFRHVGKPYKAGVANRGTFFCDFWWFPWLRIDFFLRNYNCHSIFNITVRMLMGVTVSVQILSGSA